MMNPYLDYHAWVQGRNYILTHSDACLIINPYNPDTDPELSTSWNYGYNEAWFYFWENDLLPEESQEIETQGTLF